MALISADQIPYGSWELNVYVGVIDGIPDAGGFVDVIDVTQAPYNADNTGVTDASAAIQAAVDAAFGTPGNQGVYCPEGIYRLENSVYINHGFSGKLFFGDGPTLTRFVDHWGAPFLLGSGGTTTFSASFADRTIVGDLTKGQDTIEIGGSTTDIPIGRCIIIYSANDDAYPNFNVGNTDVGRGQAVVAQRTQVVSKTANTLTFFPPIYEARSGTSIIEMLSFQLSDAGFEGFSVDCNAVSAIRAIYAMNMWNCWIKNVTITGSSFYGIVLENCVQSELRRVTVYDGKVGGSNGAGLLCGIDACLIIDSVFDETFPSVELNGSQGNVFLDSYFGTNLDTNHGPFCRFNVFEACAIIFTISDGYFGGEGRLTFYRCYFFHDEYNGVNLRRGTRDAAVVGCIHEIGPIGDDGYPNIANILFDGTCDTSTADYWKDFGMTGTLTTRTSDTVGVITLDGGDLYYDAGTTHPFTIYWGSIPMNSLGCTVTSYDDGTKICGLSTAGVLPAEDTVLHIGPSAFYPGFPAGGTFEERDLAVAATTVDKGNYFVNLDEFSSLGGDTLVDSLIRTGTPAHYTAAGLAYPPYNSESPGSRDPRNIPAGLRYLGEAAPESGSLTVTNLIAATLVL